MKAVSNARKRGDNRLAGDKYLLIYDVSTKSRQQRRLNARYLAPLDMLTNAVE